MAMPIRFYFMNKQAKREAATLADIKRGVYRDCYLVYNRKSLDEPNSQKNSLNYQRAENTASAVRENLRVAPVSLTGFCTDGVVSEKHSGFKEGDELTITDDGMVRYRIERPKFQKLLQHLSQGHFKGVICLSWDRISRNRGDDTVIRKLMRHGVDVRFAYADYDDSSAGQLHMDIDGMFAQHHSRVTSEKVTLSTRHSRLQGKCTYRAPIGYLNTGSMDQKPTDPKRAPIIREMFNLYVTGEWSLADLARFATNQGFTTLPMRRRRSQAEILADEDDDEGDLDTIRPKTSRPVTENHVSRILRNPFYTGRVIGPDGEYIPSSSHGALVTDEVFNAVQAVLARKTVSLHYVEKLDHPMRGLVRCAHCRRVYTPYTKKGILYFNARCVTGCPNTLKNCNFTFMAERIGSLIAGLRFTDGELEEIDARASTDIVLLQEKRQAELAKLERRKKRAREELSYLEANRLALLKSGAYTAESLVAERARLHAELNAAKTDEDISDEAMRELLDEVVLLSELLKDLIPTYNFAEPREKEQIARVIFSELFLAQDVLDYKVKGGFEPFVDRISATRDPVAWLSEISDNRAEIRKSIAALKSVRCNIVHDVRQNG